MWTSGEGHCRQKEHEVRKPRNGACLAHSRDEWSEGKLQEMAFRGVMDMVQVPEHGHVSRCRDLGFDRDREPLKSC